MAAIEFEFESDCPAGDSDVNCLVFDMRNPMPDPVREGDALGAWYAWRYPGSEPRGAVYHDGAVHWVDDEGLVRREDPESYADSEAQILTELVFAPISMAGLQGAERLYKVQLDGTARGACGVQISADMVQDDVTAPAAWNPDPVMLTGTETALDARPSPGRCTSFAVTVAEVESDELTEGYALRGIGLEVGIAGKLRRINPSRRVPG